MITYCCSVLAFTDSRPVTRQCDLYPCRNTKSGPACLDLARSDRKNDDESDEMTTVITT